MLADHTICSGCTACVAVCPSKALMMQEEAEGFSYPVIDPQKCTHCGLCEKVCPVLRHKASSTPRETYAAQNLDESVLMQSASGGVFPALAKTIFSEKGILFGACFNNKWEVIHNYTDNEGDLIRFQGSKYIQSKIGDSYREAEHFLQDGKTVLFSGTPCQIAGLKAFLRKDYDNLLTVEVVCHGVASFKVWQRYLAETCQSESAVDIRFKDKRTGWLHPFFVIDYGATADCHKEYLYQNIFFKGYIANLFLRPSCYRCQAKGFRSGSDLTMGDFWGINESVSDFQYEKGVSCLLINSEKGRQWIEKAPLKLMKVDYSQILAKNIMLEKSAMPHPKRSLFFMTIGDTAKSFSQIITRLTKQSLYRRVRNKVKEVIIKIIKK